MLERDVSPPSLLAGALRCQSMVLILLCLGSPSSPRSWRMDLAVLREDLNLSWGWQRPGDKSLCAWGDQTPLSQHLFGWHRDLCCELLATVMLHSVEGVWNFWCSLPWTLPRRSPPDGRKALNPARIPAACNWSRGKTRGTKELGEFIEGNFENSTLNLSTQTSSLTALGCRSCRSLTKEETNARHPAHPSCWFEGKKSILWTASSLIHFQLMGKNSWNSLKSAARVVWASLKSQWEELNYT